ncbi:MAG: diguanylate cyclase [Pseudomonadota bacterium]
MAEVIEGGSRFVNVLRLLDDLNLTEAGSVLYANIKDMLVTQQAERHALESSYGRLLHALLSVIAANHPDNPELQTQLKVLALRLSPPLSREELTAAQRQLAGLFGAIRPIDLKQSKEYTESIAALLRAFEGRGAVDRKRKARHEPPSEVGLERDSRIARPEPSRDRTQPPEGQVDAAYRHHLEQQHDEFNRIEREFAQTLREAIDKSNAFSRVLDEELAAIADAQSIDALEVRRRKIIDEIQTLRQSHERHAESFQQMNAIISELDTDNRKLTEELNRVRMLSMTDELTGLHNRRAFTRRLEEEIARAERYGPPVTVMIMDLDHFKAVNDQYGHFVGDMVLKLYAKDVFAIFRQHDMVARYGGEEFVVILPNTTLEGGLCALAKVQRRVSKITCRYQEARFKLPTFSAGVAQYVAGETINGLMRRVDEAMYRAKHGGRNAVVVADAPSASAQRSGPGDATAR